MHDWVSTARAKDGRWIIERNDCFEGRRRERRAKIFAPPCVLIGRLKGEGDKRGVATLERWGEELELFRSDWRVGVRILTL